MRIKTIISKSKICMPELDDKPGGHGDRTPSIYQSLCMRLSMQTADLPASPADKNSADTVKRPDFPTEADTKADRAQQDIHYVSIHPIGVAVQCCPCDDFIWLRPTKYGF